VTLNAFLTKFGKQINLNFLPQNRRLMRLRKIFVRAKKQGEALQERPGQKMTSSNTRKGELLREDVQLCHD
jgi:hypothetical protein